MPSARWAGATPCWHRAVQEIERFFACPHCWAEVSVLLDPTVKAQAYVEDCEVCCRPIAIAYEADGEEITEFSVEPVEQ